MGVDADFVPGFPTADTASPEETVTLVPPPKVKEPDEEIPLLPQEDEPEDADIDGDGEGDEEVLETVEVEIDGKTYTVPKAIEDHLLREEDYTQKTQTLSEQRKQVEAFQAQLQERAALQEAIMDDAAQVRGLETQLVEYEKIDWPAYHLQNPQAAQYHKLQMEQLQSFHGKAMQALNEKVQHVQSLQSKSRDETIQRTVTALEKPDPVYGWPGYSAKHMDSLDSDAEKIFGLSAEERSRITSPKSIKILHAAVSFVKSLQKAAAATPKPTVEAKPVKQVPSNRGRNTPSVSGDELPVDKWVERERAKQARKMAALNGSSRI